MMQRSIVQTTHQTVNKRTQKIHRNRNLMKMVLHQISSLQNLQNQIQENRPEEARKERRVNQLCWNRAKLLEVILVPRVHRVQKVHVDTTVLKDQWVQRAPRVIPVVMVWTVKLVSLVHQVQF